MYRPSGEIDTRKKVIDTKYIKRLNEEQEIENLQNEILNSSYRAPLNRQISPLKKQEQKKKKMVLTPKRQVCSRREESNEVPE